MNLLSILFLQATPMEEVFFGSGKAWVVLAVGATILLGLVGWIWRAQIRLKELEQHIKAMNAEQMKP